MLETNSRSVESSVVMTTVLPLRSLDRRDPSIHEQFVATGMDTCQGDKGPARIQGGNDVGRRTHGHVGPVRLPPGSRLVATGVIDVLDFGETFQPQQLLCQVLRRQADRGGMDETDLLHFGWRLGSGPEPRKSEERRGTNCARDPAPETATSVL